MVQLAPRKRKASPAVSDQQPSPLLASTPLPHASSLPSRPAKKLRTQESSADKGTGNRQPPAAIASRRLDSWSTLRGPTALAPRPGSDIVDLGKLRIPAGGPGPSQGSLLSLRHPDSPASPTPSPCVHGEVLPIQAPLRNLSIPSLYPPLTRQSLQKLGLEVALRNEQLLHDLLFGAGLQFRVNPNPQKLVTSNQYWDAVYRELSSTCTCLNYNMEGEPLPISQCICSQISRPITSSIAFIYPSRQLIVVTTPSRIPFLLSELRDMLLYIIRPLPRFIPHAPRAPQAPTAVIDTYSKQESHLRSIFDPQLIEQELLHSSYDPSGLFRSISDLLKQHCAPMRDATINAVVERACQGGGPASACSALRMCFDLLELMKLDITNHELKTARGALVETAIKRELSAFTNGLEGARCSLTVTQAWLKDAHRKLSSPDRPSEHWGYDALCRSAQMRFCILRGMTDAVFSQPITLSVSSPKLSQVPTETTPLPALPETTRLDIARIRHLSHYPIHTTVIVLAVLFHRQLYQMRHRSGDPGVIPSAANILALKKELWEIWSSSIGHAKSSREASSSPDQWRQACRDLALHTLTQLQPSRDPSTHSDPCGPTGLALPNAALVRLADRWADKNMQLDSALYNMVHARLREAVFLTTVHMSEDYTARSSSPRKDVCSQSGAIFNYLEPFQDETRALSHQLFALSSIHASIYLPLYEQACVLDL